MSEFVPDEEQITWACGRVYGPAVVKSGLARLQAEAWDHAIACSPLTSAQRYLLRGENPYRSEGE